MSEKEPRRLEYFPEVSRTNSSAVAIYVFLLPVLVLIVVGAFDRMYAWPAAFLTAALMILRKKRQKEVPQAVLEIKGDRLSVTGRSGQILLDSPLSEITSVCLDTKAVQKVQESMQSGVPDARFINATVGPSIDESRIEIQKGDEVFRLTEHYTSNIDASEWFSKIRRLLRKHGWVPLDEREDHGEEVH